MVPEPLTPPLSEAERRMCEAIDGERLIEQAGALIRIESWNGQETPAQELMAGWMAEAGLDVDVWELDLPEVQAHPACSSEIERERALGVVGSLGGGGDGPTLVLNGHVDVVPPGEPELWSSPPFEPVVRNGYLCGRGALDMKGQLAAGLAAVRAVAGSGTELPGTVRLQSVIAEEDGGMGTLAAALRYGGADGAVVLEPTRLVVAPLQAGCLNFRVHVPGLAAHGAVRSEGVSAIENAYALLAALRELEVERNRPELLDPLLAEYAIPYPISVGTISGGDWASSVADRVTFEGRMGVRPDEPLDAARTELERSVAAGCADHEWLSGHPARVEWWGGRFFPMATPSDAAITRTLGSALQSVTGKTPAFGGVTFGADAGLLATVTGTPTVLFGAGDIRAAHRPDEHVSVDDLVTLARTLAVLIVRFCG